LLDGFANHFVGVSQSLFFFLWISFTAIYFIENQLNARTAETFIKKCRNVWDNWTLRIRPVGHSLNMEMQFFRRFLIEYYRYIILYPPTFSNTRNNNTHVDPIAILSFYSICTALANPRGTSFGLIQWPQTEFKLSRAK